MKEVDQSERETARWVLLNALYHGGDFPVAERVLLTVLEAVPIKATASDVRAHLAYLQSSGLVKVQHLPHGTWCATITRDGTDVVEYNSDCPAGIARPKKYW